MLAAASATLLLATASSGAGSGPTHPGTGPNPRNCSCSCELTSGCGGPLSTVAPNVMLMSDSIGANGAPHLRLRSPRTPQTPHFCYSGSGYFTNVKALLGANNDSVTGAGSIPVAAVHHIGGAFDAPGHEKNGCGASFVSRSRCSRRGLRRCGTA